MVRCLAHLLDQRLHTSECRAISWHGDGFGTGREVRKLVQGCDGFFAGGGFAGGDVDFGGAGLKKAI